MPSPSASKKQKKNLAWEGGLENGRLVVLDQTRLPRVERYVPLRDLEGVMTAIVEGNVAGAASIGIAGAYGVVLHLIPRATAAAGKGSSVLGKHVDEAIKRLTAVPGVSENLGVDLMRQRACYKRHIGHLTALEMCARLLMEAKRIQREAEELAKK